MKSYLQAEIEADCKAHRVGIAGPDGTILASSRSPTPSGPARSTHRRRRRGGVSGLPRNVKRQDLAPVAASRGPG
jgi:hypothetical protein